MSPRCAGFETVELAPAYKGEHGDIPAVVTDPFFPDGDLPPQLFEKAVAVAKATCADCPVRRSCLVGALGRREAHGVWGGTTPEERVDLLAQIGAAA